MEKKHQKFLGWGASTIALGSIACKTSPILLLTKTTIAGTFFLSGAYVAVALVALQCIVSGFAWGWGGVKRLALTPKEQMTVEIDPAAVVEVPPPGATKDLLNRLANLQSQDNDFQNDDNIDNATDNVFDYPIHHDDTIICTAPTRATRRYKTEVEKLLDSIHPDVVGVAPKQRKENPQKRISPQTRFYGFDR